MIIEHTGIVHKIYKSHADNWCIEIKRTETQVKGITTYIGFKSKPDLRVGEKVFKGQEI